MDERMREGRREGREGRMDEWFIGLQDNGVLWSNRSVCQLFLFHDGSLELTFKIIIYGLILFRCWSQESFISEERHPAPGWYRAMANVYHSIGKFVDLHRGVLSQLHRICFL